MVESGIIQTSDLVDGIFNLFSRHCHLFYHIDEVFLHNDRTERADSSVGDTVSGHKHIPDLKLHLFLPAPLICQHLFFRNISGTLHL